MDEGVYFPGGNAVNVAVNCKRNGAERVNYSIRLVMVVTTAICLLNFT